MKHTLREAHRCLVELGSCCVACFGLEPVDSGCAAQSPGCWAYRNVPLIFPDSVGGGTQGLVPAHKDPTTDLHPSFSIF